MKYCLLLFLAFLSLVLYGNNGRNMVFLNNHGFEITAEGKILNCPPFADINDYNSNGVPDLAIAFNDSVLVYRYENSPVLSHPYYLLKTGKQIKRLQWKDNRSIVKPLLIYYADGSIEERIITPYGLADGKRTPPVLPSYASPATVINFNKLITRELDTLRGTTLATDIGDSDGDGLMEFVYSLHISDMQFPDSSVMILYEYQKSTNQIEEIYKRYEESSSMTILKFFDINNDGYDEIFYNGSYYNMLMYDKVSKTYSPYFINLNFDGYDLNFGDPDGDGEVEAITIYNNWPINYILQILDFTLNGQGVPIFNIEYEVDYFDITSLTVGNIDADAADEILLSKGKDPIAYPYQKTKYLDFNPADSTFSYKENFEVRGMPGRKILHDYNHDGLVDIIGHGQAFTGSFQDPYFKRITVYTFKRLDSVNFELEHFEMHRHNPSSGRIRVSDFNNTTYLLKSAELSNPLDSIWTSEIVVYDLNDFNNTPFYFNMDSTKFKHVELAQFIPNGQLQFFLPLGVLINDFYIFQTDIAPVNDNAGPQFYDMNLPRFSVDRDGPWLFKAEIYDNVQLDTTSAMLEYAVNNQAVQQIDLNKTGVHMYAGPAFISDTLDYGDYIRYRYKASDKGQPVHTSSTSWETMKISRYHFLDDFEKSIGDEWINRGWIFSQFGSDNSSAAKSNDNTYPNNTENILMYGNPLSLSVNQSAYLSFEMWGSFQSGSDYGYVEVSRDTVTWMPVGEIYTGAYSFPPKRKLHSLNDYCGADSLWFRFRLSTDSSGQAYGWIIDNVALIADSVISTGVKAHTDPVIRRFHVSANYPNPFNNSTTFRIYIPASGNLRLRIYDILGREVTELSNTRFEAGVYSFSWNGKNSIGHSVSSGIYLLHSVYNSNTARQENISKLLMLK